MGKNIGPAHVPTAKQWLALERHANATHRLIWALMRYTGARIGEVLLLRVKDIYKDPNKRQPLDRVTYWKENRKGKIETLVIPINNALRQYLTAYTPPLTPDSFLFPGARDGHLSYEAVEDYLSRCKEKADLSHLPIRSHSGRRDFATTLAELGVSLVVIGSFTGHKNLNNLRKYINVSQDQQIKALDLLT